MRAEGRLSTGAAAPFTVSRPRVQAVGVYVHFPYCLKKCPYCDFVSFAKARAEIDHAGYADVVLAEPATRRGDLEGRRVETVFFGGGTPSLWEPQELGRVLAGVLGAASEVAADVEVTAERNPSGKTLDEARARGLLGVGVNRLSVGVQGLSDERLRFLGRLHDPAGALAAVRAAIRAGTPRVSGDIIFAVETESEAARAEDARADVAAVADTGVTHLSAYALTIEPKTAFGELARKGKLPIATDDAQADAFLAVEAELEARGFAHYEVSNREKAHAEARHNLGYCEGRDYLGLGCGAVGTMRGRRYRNVANPEGYLAGAFGRAPLEASHEELDAETRLAERIMLGLRLERGVDVAAAALELGVAGWTPSREKAAARLVRAGRVEVDGGRVRAGDFRASPLHRRYRGLSSCDRFVLDGAARCPEPLTPLHLAQFPPWNRVSCAPMPRRRSHSVTRLPPGHREASLLPLTRCRGRVRRRQTSAGHDRQRRRRRDGVVVVAVVVVAVVVEPVVVVQRGELERDGRQRRRRGRHRRQRRRRRLGRRRVQPDRAPRRPGTGCRPRSCRRRACTRTSRPTRRAPSCARTRRSTRSGPTAPRSAGGCTSRAAA